METLRKSSEWFGHEFEKQLGILTHLHSDFPLTSLDHICSRLEQSYQCPGVCWCTDVTWDSTNKNGDVPMSPSRIIRWWKSPCSKTVCGIPWFIAILTKTIADRPLDLFGGAQFSDKPTWCKNMSCKNGSKTMLLIHSLRQIYRISPYLCRIFTSVSLIPKAMCNFPAVEKPWQTRHSELVPNPNRSDSLQKQTNLAFRRSKHELSIHERWFPDSIDSQAGAKKGAALPWSSKSHSWRTKCKNMLEESSIPSDKFI